MRRLPGPIRALVVTIVVGGVAVGACLAALLPGAATLVTAQHYTSNKIGKLRDLAQRTTIYDSANNVIATLGLKNREDVSLTQVPKILQDAVIAVEDKTFWTNDGVDINSVFRAALKNLTSGQIEQGGSTITQQLVKNRLLSSKRTINRKIREIILAVRLNEKYSKKSILEQYLNTVYFGQGSYGVKTAVERFFLHQGLYGPATTSLDQVTPGEAALLAGVISNPEGNNPFVHPDRAKARRAFALEQMLNQGYITPVQAVAGNAEPLPTIKPEAELRPRTSWAEEVQDRLIHDPVYKALGDTPTQRKNRLLTGGLKVYATLDPRVQQNAQDAMNAILPEHPGFTGALVAMDPNTGEVRAMFAGPGFEKSQYNIATSFPGRQAGSTWKTITIAAALDAGYSPNDLVSGDSPCAFGALGKTQNAEPGGGIMTLRDATKNSVNCAFARIEQSVGFPAVIAQAHKMGIVQNTLKPILTLTLGAIETAPLEMATVASTVASGGMHHPPLFVSKITTPSGDTIFDAKDVPGDKAMSPEAAACETDLLRGVVTGGTGTAANLADRPVVGKTGTTDDLADANFLGFTPGQLATFIWHGNALGRIPGAGFGGNIPARIFNRFMESALSGAPVAPLPDPGPDCARPGAVITENGRIANLQGLFPQNNPVPTTTPPTIVIQPTTPTTQPPITILPPTTKPPPPTTPTTKGPGP